MYVERLQYILLVKMCLFTSTFTTYKLDIIHNLQHCSHVPKHIDNWNGLKKEVIMAKNVHQLKEKLDNHRYLE